jgi:hypothetical protein
LNPGRRSGKPATNRLSNGAALYNIAEYGVQASIIFFHDRSNEMKGQLRTEIKKRKLTQMQQERRK